MWTEMRMSKTSKKSKLRKIHWTNQNWSKIIKLSHCNFMILVSQIWLKVTWKFRPFPKVNISIQIIFIIRTKNRETFTLHGIFPQNADQTLCSVHNRRIQRTNGFWNQLTNIVLFPLSANLVLGKVWVKFCFHYCDPSATFGELHILTNVGLISTGQVRTYFDILYIVIIWFEPV